MTLIARICAYFLQVHLSVDAAQILTHRDYTELKAYQSLMKFLSNVNAKSHGKVTLADLNLPCMDLRRVEWTKVVFGKCVCQ